MQVVVLTSKAVLIQTVEEVTMWCRLSDVCPHGRKSSLKMPRDIMTTSSRASFVPPCEIHKPLLISFWETALDQAHISCGTTKLFMSRDEWLQ